MIDFRPACAPVERSGRAPRLADLQRLSSFHSYSCAAYPRNSREMILLQVVSLKLPQNHTLAKKLGGGVRRRISRAKPRQFGSPSRSLNLTNCAIATYYRLFQR